MPVRFENRYQSVGDKALNREFVRGILEPKAQRIARWVLLVAVVLETIVIGVLCVRMPELWPELWNRVGVLWIVMAAFVALLFAWPSCAQWFIARTDKRLMFGESPETVVTFSDDGIVLREGPHQTEISYQNLTNRIRETENLRMIRLRNKGYLMLKKGAFTVGNEDELLPFLREKCGWEN